MEAEIPFMLGLSLFHRKLYSLEIEFRFFLLDFFSGGEAQMNNTVSGIAVCNHVPYLGHMDIFVPNAVNHLFSHFQS